MKKSLFFKHVKLEVAEVSDAVLEQLFSNLQSLKPYSNKEIVSMIKHSLNYYNHPLKTRTIYEILSKTSGYQNYNVALSKQVDFRNLFFEPYKNIQKTYSIQEIERNPYILEQEDTVFIPLTEYRMLDLSFRNIKTKLSRLPKILICRKGIILTGQDSIQNMDEITFDSEDVSFEDCHLSKIPNLENCHSIVLAGNNISVGTLPKDIEVYCSTRQTYDYIKQFTKKIEVYLEPKDLKEFDTIEAVCTTIHVDDLLIPKITSGFLNMVNLNNNRVTFQQDSLPDGLEYHGTFQDFTSLPKTIKKIFHATGDFQSIKGFPTVIGDLRLGENFDSYKDDAVIKSKVSGKIIKY